MFRKILILFVMVPVLAAAAASGASLPILLLMGSRLPIALTESSARNEPQE